MQLKPKIKLPVKKEVKPLSKAAPSQISIEIKTAVDRYLRMCGSGRMSRKRTLYERPWFLVTGPEGSGKSTLLSKPVITPQFSYPGEGEGFVSGTSTPLLQWKFCDEAVWIDLNGKALDDANHDDFVNILSALGSLRPKSPVDGLLIVLDIDMFQNTDQNGAKEIGGILRNHLDTIIKIWGIEIPVFLLFSKTDKIIGFNEIFSDTSGKWSERSLGAVIPAAEQGLPRHVFLEEFRDLIDSVNGIRLKMLAREKQQLKRNLICQFPINLESIREKIGTFIAMLLKPSTFTGKPLFSGFFFTSCLSVQSTGEEIQESSAGLGDTLAGHPLNPNRDMLSGSPVASSSRKITYFAKAIFSSIIPRHTYSANKTEMKKREETRGSLIRICAGAAVCTLVLWTAWWASFSVKSYENRLMRNLSVRVDQSLEGIVNLAKISDLYHQTGKHAYSRRTIPMILTCYNAKRMHESVKRKYIEQLYRNIALPCSTVLVDSIQTMIEYDNSSPLNNFSALKGSLQALLHISKAGKNYSDLILSPADTTYISSILFSDVQKAYGINIQDETARKLKLIIGDYVKMICQGEFDYLLALGPDTLNPLVVRHAQRKLVDLFNYDAVYSSTIRKCIDQSKQLYLTDIIPDAADMTLQSGRPLCEAFTPQGWNRIVRPTLDDASRRLNKVENWVKGENEINTDRTAINRNELYAFLIKRYLEDVNISWRDFFNSLDMSFPGSIGNAGDVFQQLGNPKSALALVIAKFSEWSQQFSNQDTTVVDVNQQLESFRSSLAFFGEFGSAVFPEYSKMLNDIGKGLASVEREKKVSSVFNGNADDPLAAAYRNTGSLILPSLPDAGKDMLKSILYLPFNKCIILLESALKDELNTAWSEQVYKPFAGQLANRYPFLAGRQSSDASFEFAIDFFDPVNGPFWQTYSTFLAPYIKEDNGKYHTRSVKGMVSLSFSPELAVCLTQAGKISDVFYKDNKKREWKIAIIPRHSSISSAKITVGKKSADIIQNSSMMFNWPILDENTNLNFDLTDNNGNRCLKSFKSQWDLMYLMNGWTVGDNSSPSADNFLVKIDLISSGGYHFILPAKVQVFDPRNPFYENVFHRFNIPAKIVQ